VKTAAALVLVLLASLAASSALAGDPAPPAEAFVAARRYRFFAVESALEASHGGGRWIEELFFPEQGVVANVVFETEFGSGTWTTSPIANAFRSDKPRNRFRRRLGDVEETVSPLEDVKVPAALAKAIFETADLRARLDAARKDVGARLAKEGLGRDLDADGNVAKPAEPAAMDAAK
jgi:hypothetical protein